MDQENYINRMLDSLKSLRQTNRKEADLAIQCLAFELGMKAITKSFREELFHATRQTLGGSAEDHQTALKQIELLAVRFHAEATCLLNATASTQSAPPSAV